MNNVSCDSRWWWWVCDAQVNTLTLSTRASLSLSLSLPPFHIHFLSPSSSPLHFFPLLPSRPSCIPSSQLCFFLYFLISLHLPHLVPVSFLGLPFLFFIYVSTFSSSLPFLPFVLYTFLFENFLFSCLSLPLLHLSSPHLCLAK